MRIFPILLLFCFAFGFSQNYTKQENQLISQTKKLDSLMQNNDSNIINLFDENFSFGHSNGWIQSLDDFKKDFTSKKVVYKEIRQTEALELKKFKKTFSIRRKIKVVGFYKNETFEMNLSLLEIWIKNKSDWKLWSRQSMEIK